jgi:hypothetical protein
MWGSSSVTILASDCADVTASRFGRAHADLIKVAKQVGWILVDTVSARRLELVHTVPARQQPDAKRPRASSSEEVPDAVANNHRKSLC